MSELDLDPGLAAAFGARNELSVLRVIERLTGETPRILLRDPVSDQGASPLIDPSSSEKRSIPQGRGSYQILGEIARGGMGVVMKGHDTDLGRDVALKVLHKELAKRPEVLQRFVEEAQIGGQLQHPGIVPVYELGLMADERPYFTMKLVKGRTLAALLAERKSGDVDRRRLLDVFESVCQTMAYAHSRGVIHRDLKPANVMVGAFGEVQVVDWGLAKVMRQGGTADEKRQKQTNISIIETVRSEPGSHGSHSLVGSVMGTPAYMSPEQARGEIEKLDERSDVFSLGAVLCEILTGLPPYIGEADKTLIEAANARLDDATKRLDGCQADAELVTLCRECLAPAQSARPRSAEVIAQRIHEHLFSVEERARTAQIDAAEARVKAREERRARKLTLGLAASVLATLVLAGGGWAWTRNEREARLRHTSEQVFVALADANLARGAEDWGAAQAAIDRAQASLEAGQATPELRASVAADSSLVESAALVARNRRERDARNTAFLEHLDRIRSLERGMLALVAADESGSPSPPSPVTGTSATTLERRDAAYLEAFDAYGEASGVHDMDVDSPDVVGLLTSSGIQSEIASALDDWAAVRADIDKGFKDRSKKLVRVAMQADSDPWRRGLRAAILAEDPAALLALVTSARERDLPPVTAIVLAKALARLQHAEESLAVLQRSLDRHPSDFPLLLQLGRQSLEAKPRRLDEALRYLTAARALRPASASALDRLGVALSYAKDFDQSERLERESLRLDPENARVWGNLAVHLHEQGKLDESIEYSRKAIELDPASALDHNNLGWGLVEKGDVDAGIACYRKAIRLDPTLVLPYCNLGWVLGNSGDLDGSIANHRKTVELEPTNAAYHVNLGYALSRRDDIPGAMASYKKAIELDPKNDRAHGNLGLLLMDLGDCEAAITSCKTAIELAPTTALWHNNLAVALCGQGDVESALANYRKAVELDPNMLLARQNLGQLLFDHGFVDEAFEHMYRIVEIAPTNVEGRTNLGAAFENLRDHAAAIENFTAAIALDPGSITARINLGITFENMGRFADALEAYQQALAIDPWDASIYDNLGHALAKNGEILAAIENHERAIQLAPRLASAYLNLGHDHQLQGEFAAAAEFCRKAIAIDPQFVSAYLSMGFAFDSMHDLDSAIGAYRKATELDPRSATAFACLGGLLFSKGETNEVMDLLHHAILLDPSLVVAHKALGDALYGMNQVDAAIEEYRTALRLDENYVPACIGLGCVLNDSKGDHDGAIVLFKKAIRLDSTLVAARNNLGIALQASGDLPGAIAAFKEGIRLAPDSISIRSRLISALNQAGDIDGAILMAREATLADPRSAPMQVSLGFALWKKGDLDGALQCYRASTVIDPQYAHGYYSAGQVLAKQGHQAEAIASYLKALAIDSKHADAHYGLGVALAQQGRFGDAITSYRKALDLAPNDATIANMLLWTLATCADHKLRNGPDAVRLALRGVQVAPDDANSYDNLGAAFCCAGEWSQAVEALEHSNRLIRAGDEFGAFIEATNRCFLAIAHANLGKLDEARDELALAQAWHEANPKAYDAVETARFLEEAGAVIAATRR